VYDGYTSYVTTGVLGLDAAGCTAIFECDKNTYQGGVNGSTIKAMYVGHTSRQASRLASTRLDLTRFLVGLKISGPRMEESVELVEARTGILDPCNVMSW
jgi:hypothetical protein